MTVNEIHVTVQSECVDNWLNISANQIERKREKKYIHIYEMCILKIFCLFSSLKIIIKKITNILKRKKKKIKKRKANFIRSLQYI